MDGKQIRTKKGVVTVAPSDGKVRVTVSTPKSVASLELDLEDAAALHDGLESLVLHLAG